MWGGTSTTRHNSGLTFEPFFKSPMTSSDTSYKLSAVDKINILARISQNLLSIFYAHNRTGSFNGACAVLTSCALWLLSLAVSSSIRFLASDSCSSSSCVPPDSALSDWSGSGGPDEVTTGSSSSSRQKGLMLGSSGSMLGSSGSSSCATVELGLQ